MATNETYGYVTPLKDARNHATTIIDFTPSSHSRSASGTPSSHRSIMTPLSPRQLIVQSESSYSPRARSSPIFLQPRSTSRMYRGSSPQRFSRAQYIDPYNVNSPNSTRRDTAWWDKRERHVWSTPKPRGIEFRRDAWVTTSQHAQAKSPSHRSPSPTSRMHHAASSSGVALRSKAMREMSSLRERKALMAILNQRPGDMQSMMRNSSMTNRLSKGRACCDMRGGLTNEDPFRR
mmetsp:Transcript_25609/g.48489  ORF Transcript_25609/g.48489 Transcript_25609/m.48489 type:complete len:234 (-) Transcript_25609:345-1046(-)